MAARARRARQLLGKEIFHCYQCTQRCRLLYSPPSVYSPPKMYSSVVQLVHVGWKIIEYTVVHATSYELQIFRCYQCTQRCRLLCSPPPMYSPPNMYSSVVQLIHVGWKIIEYTGVHATSYELQIFRCCQCAQRCRLLYSPPNMYSNVVQLVNVGWKVILIEYLYTVVHATSYVLYCHFRCTQRLLGIRVYCCSLCTSRRY